MVVTVVSVGSTAPEIVTFVGVLLMPPLLLSSPQPASTTSRLLSVGGRKGWNERGGLFMCLILFSSRRRHTRLQGDWSSDVCSSDLLPRAYQAVERLTQKIGIPMPKM